MNDPHWYVGPWIWNAGGVMPCWRPPVGTVGCLDTRAIPHMSTAGGSPQGQGVFLSDGPIKDSNYTLLGTGGYRDVKTSQALRDRMPTRDKKRQPQGDDLLSHLLDCLCDGSDPTGDSFAKPIMPDASMRVRLTIGGFDYQWKTAPWNYHWDKIQDVERADFQRCFDDAQSGRLKDKQQHRRVLDALCDKYGARGADDWKMFVPVKLRASIPGRLKHETSYSDDFNRADSTGLGASWAAVTNNFNVSSNTAVVNALSSACRVRYESDLSSSDNYAQSIIFLGSSGYSEAAPATRFSASANTHYGFAVTSNGTDYLYKIVAGAGTVLTTGSLAVALRTIKTQASGSAITGYADGTSQLSATDTAISAGLRGGMYGYRTTDGYMDDFLMSDIAASGTNYTQLERSTRGLLRGVYTHYQGG